MQPYFRLFLLSVLICCCTNISAQTIVSSTSNKAFNISDAIIFVDINETALVKKSAHLLQEDIEKVTGKKPAIKTSGKLSGKTVIVLGTAAQSSYVQQLLKSKKIKIDAIQNKWEGYQIQTLSKPIKGVSNALVIIGNDRRGLAFGVFELSKQMGISPWYWWADVPVTKKAQIFIKQNITISDFPQVKYRGIFINDEAPALSNWSKEKFGGFNSQFYAKVFELMLRLKSNYIWPAMWGNAFYDDDIKNRETADEYGIVIGTSHHEPLMRAHDEWRRYGKGKWNYDSNAVQLQQFWRDGMQRASNEKIVSVGMRGDGDEPMSNETATALLEKIVKDQRNIISEVTRKPAEATPQLWALYKEVQDYYDKGMRVPDDVTLLLCDDNWGNLRKLPKPTDKARKGGYGIYYHFDYVGGPRNYKWINTNPLPRIWEQMNLAWEHNVKDIWIVNVGDIKPMEVPVSFFLDYAWNPTRIDATDLDNYTQQWAAAQFGNEHSKDIANLLSKYAKYNSRRKPELLDDKTFSLNNHYEFGRVVNEYQQLLETATSINNKITADKKDAYFQLVLHPIEAMANLYNMYYYTALNKDAGNKKYLIANSYADSVRAMYLKDSMISIAYHQLNNGKWNHMMSQTHIGYTYWQQPPHNKIPALMEVTAAEAVEPKVFPVKDIARSVIPASVNGHAFYEEEESGVSIDAHHYSSAVGSNNISWKMLPDHGRTSAAITTTPVTAAPSVPGEGSPHVAYEIYTLSSGKFTINAYFSPTLNFHNNPEGLQYAISVDDEAPQIMSINKENKNSYSGIWNKWAAENIIIKSTTHTIKKPGKHVIKFWRVHAGVVLQKITADFGNTLPTYLGAAETKN